MKRKQGNNSDFDQLDESKEDADIIVNDFYSETFSKI